jgi:glycosyltransferase involved in cell wall biosynthesis
MCPSAANSGQATHGAAAVVEHWTLSPPLSTFVVRFPANVSKIMTLKVCVTGLRGFPDIMGGIEAHCQNLYPRMRASSSDIDYVVFGRSPYLPATPFSYRDIRVEPLWTVRQKHLETFVYTFLSLMRARFSEKADVVHIHAIGPNLLTPLARLLGLVVVATHHGHDYQRLKWGRIAKTALRLGESMMVLFAHRVICVSEASADMLRARFPAHAAQISYIPNGAALTVWWPTRPFSIPSACANAPSCSPSADSSPKRACRI